MTPRERGLEAAEKFWKALRNDGACSLPRLIECAITSAVEEAKREERERCAKVAEEHSTNKEHISSRSDFDIGNDYACEEIASAIREGRES